MRWTELMNVLKSQQMLSGPHQKFAEGIAGGMTTTEAYSAAYPDSAPRSARANGARLMANDSIASEVSRLRKAAEQAADGTVMTLAEELRFLTAVVRTPVREVEPGSPLAQEWSEETTDFGGKTRVKMPDKLRALELFAKLTGQLNDKLQVTGDVQIKVTIGG